MKRNTATNNVSQPLFSDIARRAERIRDITRTLLGRTATANQIERPIVAPDAEANVGKLSFRGLMAFLDKRRAQTDLSAENQLRASISERFAEEERANPNAPINLPKEQSYDWSTGLSETAPAVIGGTGNEYATQQSSMPLTGVIGAEHGYQPQQSSNQPSMPH